MGCTSSTATPNLPTSPSPHDEQLLISESFRQWLQANRVQAEEELHSSLGGSDTNQRTLLSKALDLLLEHPEVRTANKFKKLVQKEVKSASNKQVTQIIDTLKQRSEQPNDNRQVKQSDKRQINSDNDEKLASSSSPGISLKEALETARISFYKVIRSRRVSLASTVVLVQGKQAAIFANPTGGYDVRILSEHDDVLNDDGNLLRSIIVTEVNHRPKSSGPCPPVDVDEIRRSIDAALHAMSHPSTASASMNIGYSPSSPVENSPPGHQVTYTEIIHSESRDGEQSRRMKRTSHDDDDDEQQPTTMKVTTKSEFSSHPSANEKTMEQSVQVISVKVRSEMTPNDSSSA
jgi:hypothetical protein